MSGPRVLITGAAGGIGSAAAAEMRRRGATVLGADLSAGDGVLACDVRDQASVDAAVTAALDTLGGLDVLVNCAGIGLPQRASERPGADATAVLDVNLLGPWRVTAAALPALRAARGRVVNIASGLAYLAVPLAPAYCMSKRGLVAFSDALRHEVGREVSVVTVYPGYVRTPIHAASVAAGFGLEGMVPAEPLDAVARRVADAALSARAPRDVATTRSGALAYAALRAVPPGWADRLVQRRLRRAARSGAMDGSPLAAELGAALRG